MLFQFRHRITSINLVLFIFCIAYVPIYGQPAIGEKGKLTSDSPEITIGIGQAPNIVNQIAQEESQNSKKRKRDDDGQQDRRITRSQRTTEFHALPNGSRSGNFSAIGLLPHRDQSTSFQSLRDAAWQAEKEVGHFAPSTIPYSSGEHLVTQRARDRKPNEQGVGIRALAQGEFDMTTKEASARQVLNESGLPMTPEMEAPYGTQSLHLIARSLSISALGEDPKNYTIGSQKANLAMQSFEKVLGQEENRGQFYMKTEVFSDPKAPMAHGIVTTIRHKDSARPSVIYSVSGYANHPTQESIREHEKLIRDRLDIERSIPSVDNIRESEPKLTHNEAEAINAMLNMPTPTLHIGTNSWSNNEEEKKGKPKEVEVKKEIK